MPVPVSRYQRPPAHPVIKPVFDFQGETLPSSADNAFSYVTPYASHQQHPGTTTGSVRDNRSSDKFNYSEGGARFTIQHSVGNSGFIPSRRWEASNLQIGLTAADNAADSKQRLAYACHSPASTFSPQQLTMGLQSHPYCRGSAKSAWSGSDEDDDCVPPLVYGALSHLQGVSSIEGNEHHAHHATGAPTIAREASFMSWDQSSFSGVGQSIEYATFNPPDANTPFADFVDRAVANNTTFASDHFIMDSQNVQPSVQSVPRQQTTAAEPLTDPAYIKSYRAMAEPLSNWVAEYVWKVCTTGVGLPQRFVGAKTACDFSGKPPASLAKSVRSLLCSTLLQPSGIVLALWYITRLPVHFGWQTADANVEPSEREFIDELFDGPEHYPSSGDWNMKEFRAPFKLILLGCMLANKWLDDHTFSNKTWHAISEVPIPRINRLELLALAIFMQDLSVPPSAWEQWLSHLRQYQMSSSPYPAPIKRPSASDEGLLLRKMIEDLTSAQQGVATGNDRSNVTPQPVFCGLLGESHRNTMQEEISMVDSYDIDLDEDGPLREEYVPKRRVSQSSSRTHSSSRSTIESRDPVNFSSALPPPSEWSPQADPPVMRDRGRHDRYLAVQPVLRSLTGQVAHNRSLSVEVSQQASYWSHSRTNATDSHIAVHNSCRGDTNIYRPARVFQSLALNFPLSTACPPISHARSTLSPASSVSPQNAAHMRSYSQSQNDYDRHPIPPTCCGKHIGFPTTFSLVHGDPAHFRPLWLRT